MDLVSGTLAEFEQQGAPKANWCRKEYERLILASRHHDFLVNRLKKQLKQMPPETVWISGPLDMYIGWGWTIQITLFTAPTEDRFLASCPEGSYELFAKSRRREFRTGNPAWFVDNYANWIFLLAPADNQASVLLDTVWAPMRLKELTAPPPMIVPVELLRKHPSQYGIEVIRESMEAYAATLPSTCPTTYSSPIRAATTRKAASPNSSSASSRTSPRLKEVGTRRGKAEV